MFQMLNSNGQYVGMQHEDAREHLKSFLLICASFSQQGVPDDALKMQLFPYSLQGRARSWFFRLPVGSITSWDALATQFVLRFNPPIMNACLRNDTTAYHQLDDENLHTIWERYNSLLRHCPMHDIQRET
ncbi:hypothetical protein Gogos_021334 [Gossypium gossypioides]|uniref:Retrotransposon gag domain-containing protein n=1 Tax=Gossypium gossypioides TaxID=34282 RepID=A0A7J9D039_GOSGO|nr:hypothetical protein [Gossypium gossypioides]